MPKKLPIPEPKSKIVNRKSDAERWQSMRVVVTGTPNVHAVEVVMQSIENLITSERVAGDPLPASRTEAAA